MEFGVLGPLQVVVSGEALALGSAQQRAVLALLIVHAPEPVSLDRLIDELWGERPPATAQHAVQVYVSAIRKLLRAADGAEDVAVRNSPSGYVIEVDPERIDARRFERLLDEAQSVLARDPPHARRDFEEALALWRGPPLADFQRSDVARHEADRLDELRALAIEGLVEASVACGEHAEVIGTITGLVAANPLRERPRRLLMLALYRSGRHAEALAAYRDACAALDQIGLQPGPELRQLEQAILRHDASLRAPDAAAETPTRGTDHVNAARVPSSGENASARRLAVVEPPGPAAPRETRKVVTALFCSITASTGVGAQLDPEALRGVMDRCFSVLRATIEHHGGTVDKVIGDALMAVFGIPRVREDDALRAVRAAAEIRERLPGVGAEADMKLSFRTAVNTGLVFSGEGENLAIGDAVNVAARLEQAAAPGEILLGSETLGLVRDAVEVEPLEPVELKGKPEPLPAFRLLGVDPLAPGLARRLDVPLVGRARELALLRAACDRVVQESGCHLFTLLGVAGVGKSRLVAELLAGAGEAASVLGGRCLHYGEGITFWPLAEALMPVGEPARPVLERLGSGGAATPQELFWDVRRLLESLAAQRPVILHVDDLQWAEPMLLDLLDHVVDLSRGAPILLLCTARPELLEERPGWGGGKLNATTVLLEPLSAADCGLLLDQLGDGLDQDTRTRVVDASEGNPLFLEEIAALARERGTVTLPPTIQALLAARLEQLAVEDRELLECGAVEGEVFHRLAVRALAGERLAAEIESRLAGLVRKELIRPHPPTVHGDHAFRFRHLLLRDAAYEGLPKAKRAEFHERFAHWLEKTAVDLVELDELAGWHLEQAVRYRRAVGRRAEPALARRATEHLHAAGRRASERGDDAAARNLLERALALTAEADSLRSRIGVDLAEQLLEAGDLARADALLAAAEPDSDAAGLAAIVRLEWMTIARPQEATRAIDSQLPGLLEKLAGARDERGLAKAHMVAWWAHWVGASRATSAAKEARLAAEHARNAGDEGLRSRALGSYLQALRGGPQDARVIANELDALEREEPGPYLAACVDLGRGELERFEGRFDEARRFTQHAIDKLRAIGMHTMAGGCQQDLAETQLWEGDPAGALASLLPGDTILAEIGERDMRSTTQALLAQAHERLGHRDAAYAAIELSDQLGAGEDMWNYVITHGVRAQLALADGDRDAAESWARSAVDRALPTDLSTLQAMAELELARVLSALGRTEEAATQARAALALYEAKGHRPGAGEARALLHELR